MSTVFKLQFEGKRDLQFDKFQQSLPSDFQVQEKDDGIYVTIKSAGVEGERAQYLIDRELDRHFFLTCVKIRAEMVRRSVSRVLRMRNRIHGSLPDSISPQRWNYNLALQLRLWSTAADITDMSAKVILIFQIIELARPAYPKYSDPTKPPDPLTECKFVRNLVAHSGDVGDCGLQLYCKHVGRPEMMIDVTDPEDHRFIATKVPLMEAEAKKIIAAAL